MQKITLNNKEYPILFDVNVIEDIQKRYGNIEKLSEKLSDIGEQKWVLTRIINEGISFDNYFNGQNSKMFTEEQIGMTLTLKDLTGGKLAQTIVSAFNECIGEEKNVTAEQILESVAQQELQL